MKIRSKIWFENDEGETIISYGKYMLLKKIDETGSISAAAQEMGISFRKAWIMVKTINERSDTPLVISHKGGHGGGGGAILTPSGKKLLKTFEAINREVEQLLNSMATILTITDGGKE